MVLVRVLTRTKWRLAFLIGIVSIAAVGAGLTLPAAAPADPGTRKAPPPVAFKSGGERSVIVLREIQKALEGGNERSEKALGEIAATLERIDTRLQRIEKAVISVAGREPSMRQAGPNRR
jgi:hypothetical protein